MASHFRLYGRPLAQDEAVPELSVTGLLGDYTEGEAFESRLSINNSVGRCTVEVLEQNLPPGATVRVDNINKQVVVKWAAYTVVDAESSLVPNGGFEDGDDGTWLPGGGNAGVGWSIGSGPDYDTFDGTHSARFAGVKTKGSDLVLPVIPAKVNDYIRITAQVQQGASSAGNAGARVSLLYLDASGRELARQWGNLVTSGSNGEWKPSKAEGGAPANTAGVLVALSAYRNKENKPLWVDAVTWDHKYTLGQQGDNVYFLKLKVRDSLNREAYWEGYLEMEANFYTSLLYPVISTENIETTGESSSINVLEQPSTSDTMSTAGQTTGFTLQVTVSYQTITMPPDTMSTAGQTMGFTLEVTVSYQTITMPPDTMSTAGQTTGFTVKDEPRYSTLPDYIATGGQTTGFTLT